MEPVEPWQLGAACRDLSIDDMFPDHLDNPELKRHVHHIAANYCAKCPVWRDCSTMTDKGEGGIYGGKIVGRSLHARGGRQRKLLTLLPAKARKAFHR